AGKLARDAGAEVILLRVHHPPLNLIAHPDADFREKRLQASEAASAVLAGSAPEPIPPAPERDPMIGRVTDAALAHDEKLLVELLRQATDSLGWVDAIEGVYFGALREIGGMWRNNRVPSATEHFLTEIVRREICQAIAGLAPPSEGRVVILACPQDERHDVGLLSLSLLLRLRGVKVCYLGSDAPAEDLIDVLRGESIAAVCIGATLASSRASATRAARQIVAAKLDRAVFVGGPAFAHGEVDGFVPGIMLPSGLGAAADVIEDRIKKETK
ncbi:MAG: cobalamin-dependent protein, partial [Dehalococcoidia bacterium]